METRTVVKFSSEDCGTCHKMSHYDSKVAKELGFQFEDVKLQDREAYSRFRKILLSKYPKKEGMGWPTYLIVSDPQGEFKIHGEIKGGMGKGEFREKLTSLVGS